MQSVPNPTNGRKPATDALYDVDVEIVADCPECGGTAARPRRTRPAPPGPVPQLQRQPPEAPRPKYRSGAISPATRPTYSPRSSAASRSLTTSLHSVLELASPEGGAA